MTASDSTKANRVVGFVFVTVFLDLVGFGIIIPLLPFYVQSMHGSPEMAGLLLSSFSLTQLVATPFLGRLSDKVGRRPVILLSLAGNAASMVLFALATKWLSIELLFVSRILAGATAGNLAACQAAIADVTTQEERTKGMGRLGAGIGLGMMVGPAMGGWLSPLGTWLPPLLAAALALLDVIAAFFFMPETNEARHAAGSPAPSGAPKPTLRSALGHRVIGVILALYFMTFLYMTTIQTSVGFLANERFAWTGADMSWVFFGFGAMMFIIQGALIGRMNRLFGARNIVIAGSCASVIGLALIGGSANAPALIGGLVCLGLGLAVVNPCLSTLAADAAGAQQRGAILGIAQSAGGLARTVGPALWGMLYKRVATGAPFYGGAIAAFVCIALSFGLLVSTQPSSERSSSRA